MNIYRDFDQLPRPDRKTVLSIGNYDGVHVGHQAILREAIELARRQNSPMYALTFEPHPLSVVRPQSAPPVLTPLDEKLRLMKDLGVPAVVVASSRMELLSLGAMDFLTQVVRPRFNPAWLVEGGDFGFGKGRQGNVDFLKEVSQGLGFSVIEAGEVDVKDEDGHTLAVSSSYIRDHLRTGDLVTATACLGHPYRLIGEVVVGKRRGRELGFPTANLDVKEQLKPLPGVYAGRMKWGGTGDPADQSKMYPAAVSIGTNLTFDPGAPPTVETHLVGFSGDLYGQRIGVDLLARIRDMRKFESPAALVQQIREDVEQTRKLTETMA